MSGAPDHVTLIFCIIAGLVGCGFTCFLLWLISARKNLRKAEYMTFVVNRSLINLAYDLHLVIFQPIGIVLWTSQPIWCVFAGALDNSLVISMALSDPVLALTRFIAICHRPTYSQICRARNAYGMCSLVWLLGPLLTIPLIMKDYLGRIPGYVCNVIMTEESFPTMMLSSGTLMIAGYGLLLFCYIRILVYVKKRRVDVQRLGVQAAIRDDKALLRYIAVEAAMPLVSSLPVSVVIWVKYHHPGVVCEWVMSVVTCFYVLCASLNPMLTLLMVRPIRLEACKVIKGLARRMSLHHQTQVIEIVLN